MPDNRGVTVLSPKTVYSNQVTKSGGQDRGGRVETLNIEEWKLWSRSAACWKGSLSAAGTAMRAGERKTKAVETWRGDGDQMRLVGEGLDG